MSHDRLTVDLARSLFESMQIALWSIRQFSDSAVARKNAGTLQTEVEKAISQIASSKSDAIVKHPNPDNFCLATHFIETAVKDDSALQMRVARNKHREVLQAIQACLADPSACAAAKKDSSDSSDSSSKKRSSWGWVLGLTGLVILTGTGIYFYKKRSRRVAA